MKNFIINNNLLAENNLFNKINNIILNDGYKKPLYLIDDGLVNSDNYKKILKIITRNKRSNIYQLDCRKEPTYLKLETTRAQVLNIFKKNKNDLILGIGGGSAMDLSKAIAALITNKKKALFYRGFDKLEKTPIPLYLIPTTVGTGSESSYNASFIDEDSKIKMGINGKNMFAIKAILDPQLTNSCPILAKKSAAIDTLVHIMEGYISKKSNNLTDMLCEKAFSLFINNFDAIISNKFPSKRLDLMISSYLSGIIQMNAGSGVASCLSYPLSVHYGVPHGIGGGIFLVDIIEYNIKNKFKKYKNLFKFVKEKNIKNNKQFLNYLRDKIKLIKFPKNLKNFIKKKTNINLVMSQIKIMKKGFRQNPIPISNDELKKILIKYI